MNRHEQMIKVQKEGFELFKKKNQDYGDAFCKIWSDRCIDAN